MIKWKRFKRRFRLRYSNKKYYMYLFLLLLTLGVGVGYAALVTPLNITGSSILAKATWDIHFANINVSNGSVEATEEANITNPTTITLEVPFNNPGDFYEFSADIVNEGTIDAMIDSIEILPVLTTEQQEYLEYMVTYDDGKEIKAKQLLEAGNIETIKVKFLYKEIEDRSKYPADDETFSLSITIQYVQKTSEAEEIDRSNTLYYVLKNEAKNGTYAREYTGSHQDSMNGVGPKKIYHWYGSDDANGTAILDKNNILFAGQCWQMIRTTDTGGVKMIYNGEAENNQCLNTRGTHVGYTGRTSQSLASNYWYGTDYTYDSTAKTFKVSGTTEQAIWNATTGPGLIGKYTCRLTSVDGTCPTLYLVESYYNTTSAYVIPLNSDSNYSQFGTLPFNASMDSPSYVGYMYNTVYPYQTRPMTSSEDMLSSLTLSTSYWYADSVTWGSPTANRYNLDNPDQVTSTEDYPSLVGKYTFSKATQTYTNTSVCYIAAVDSKTMYCIYLSNSGNHTLSDFNYTYTYGESYTDNGDGTYTINHPTTIHRSDWYTSYRNVQNKYVCKNAINNTCSELRYITEASTKSMRYIKVANNYKYSKGFTWDGSKYILDNDNSVTFWNINDSTNKTSINNAHYTCWNEVGVCPMISYIYYIDDKIGPMGIEPFYINLTGGKDVETAINEMLYDDGVNSINSTIKSGIDAWYKHYLLEDYDDYIEDTIFCNDRSIRSLNGWNPNGGMINENLQFKEYIETSDLSCTNTTDKFSVSNNSAKLTYKVGLMSSPEMNILNNNNARNTGQRYWLASPSHHLYPPAYFSRGVDNEGKMSSFLIFLDLYGVRPAISLIPGIEYVSGDGSMANPYVVATE